MIIWYKGQKDKQNKDKLIKSIQTLINKKMMIEKKRKQDNGMTGKIKIKKVQEIKIKDIDDDFYVIYYVLYLKLFKLN
jgi:hypothetical protein